MIDAVRFDTLIKKCCEKLLKSILNVYLILFVRFSQVDGTFFNLETSC